MQGRVSAPKQAGAAAPAGARARRRGHCEMRACRRGEAGKEEPRGRGGGAALAKGVGPPRAGGWGWGRPGGGGVARARRASPALEGLGHDVIL